MKKLLFILIMIFSALWMTGQNYYTVSVVMPPPLVTDAGPNISTCFYDSIQIGNVNLATGGLAPYTYSWFPTYGLSDPTIPNPMALPDDTTTYSVTVTDANNCTSWSQMTVNINSCAGIVKINNNFEFNVYPNPNSGSVFYIDISGKKLYTEYEVTLFNIFGQKVFSTEIHANDRLWTGSVDVGTLAGKGMFILEIHNAHIKNYQKIIIQ